MKGIKLTKKFWIAFSTMGVIALIFAYYFLVYSKNNEKTFYDKRFRDLRRIAKNVIQSKKDRVKRGEFDFNTAKKKIIEQHNDQIKTDSAIWAKEKAKNPKRNAETIAGIKEHARKRIAQVLKASQISRLGKDEISKFRIDSLDRFYLKIRPVDNVVDSYGKLSFLDDFKSSKDQEDLQYYQSVKLSEFVRKDLNIGLSLNAEKFEDFFIIRVLYPGKEKEKQGSSFININCKDCKEKSSNRHARIAYQSFSNEIRLDNLDTLLAVHNGLNVNPIVHASINYGSSIIFPHRISFEDDEDWILCGIVSESKLESDKHEVESFWIVILALILMFIILALPVIKFAVMGTVERLRIINVWFTGFGLVVGTAVLTLLMIFFYEFFGYEREMDLRVKLLSDSVSKTFEDEIKETQAQVDSLARATEKLKTTEIYNGQLDEGAILLSIANKSDVDRRKIFYDTRKLFSQCVWINDNGDQTMTLETNVSSQSFRLPNLRDRRYFTRALGDSLWLVPGTDPAENKRFAMQSIKNWRSGNAEAGISIKTDKLKSMGASVVAMATRLYSVMDPLLSPGYKFCIIDGLGDVWFHSDKMRNLQENIFEETNNDPHLKAAMKGRLSVPVSLQYGGKDHRTLISPIGDTPLFIVVMHDNEYYKSPLLLTLGFSITMILLFFLLQSIQLIALYFTNRKSTRLKIKQFYLSWLHPVRDEYFIGFKGAFKPSEKYKRSLIAQFLIGLMLTILLFIFHERWLVLVFVLLPIYLCTFHFILLTWETTVYDSNGNFNSRWVFKPFICSSIVLIFFVNVWAAAYVENILLALTTQGMIIIICFISVQQPFHMIWEKNSSVYRFVEYWAGLKKPGRLYKLFIVGWLVVASVLPTICYYKSAHYFEYLAWSRYLQMETAQRFMDRQKKFMGEKIPSFKNQLTSVNAKGVYLFDTKEIFPATESLFNAASENRSKSWIERDQLFFGLLFSAGPSLKGLVEESRHAVFEMASDGSRVWKVNEDNTLLLKVFNQNTNDHDYYASSVVLLDPTKGDYQLFFSVVVLIIIVTLYFIVRFCVKYIFGLGLFEPTLQIKTIIDEGKISEKYYGSNLFIVGLPGSDIDNILSSPVNNVDFRYPPYQWSTREMVKIRHFEYGINNHKINQDKLAFLLSLGKSSVGQIVIFSSVQPSVIIEFYDRILTDIEPVRFQPEYANEYKEYKYASRFWKNVLNDFTVLYQPLAKNLEVSSRSELQNEIGHGTYLQSLNKLIPDYSPDSFNKEEMIMKVEELAENYYHSLWNSFSKEEKFLLYDLAKDQFVNMKNIKVIRDLINKGIIMSEDSVRLMNSSFNNFILLVVKEDEEMNMDSEMRQKGNWKTIQLIIIIVVLAIATFIGFSQQGLLSNVNALLGTLTGLATLLIRFGGLFSTSKVKE